MTLKRQDALGCHNTEFMWHVFGNPSALDEPSASGLGNMDLTWRICVHEIRKICRRIDETNGDTHSFTKHSCTWRTCVAGTGRQVARIGETNCKFPTQTCQKSFQLAILPLFKKKLTKFCG